MIMSADWGPVVPFDPQDCALPGEGRHHRPDSVMVIPGVDSDSLLEVVYQAERTRHRRATFGWDLIYPQHRPDTAGEHVTVAKLAARCGA